MKNQSIGGLLNLSAVSRIIKSADTIYWQQEGGWNTVSDGHTVFYFGGVCDALYARFRESSDGVMLCSRKRGKELETFPAPQIADTMKRFLKAEDACEVVDTRLSYEFQKDKVVRVLHITDRWNGQEYGYIADGYFATIAGYDRIHAEKASAKVPVTFERGDEKAVILPVNVNRPGFLAEIR